MVVRGIKITNPEKVVYKKGNITKADVINYYDSVAELMLKRIKGRPITAFRCHGGIDGECFFKKHPHTDSTSSVVMIDGEPYFYIDSPKDIIYQAQMGTIEFHTWGCHASNVDEADQMVFDLDPAEDVSLKKLKEATLLVKGVLDQLDLDSSLKTSGGKGFHIVADIQPMSWEEFSQISRQIAELLEAQHPSVFTTNMRKNQRGGKIFLDYLRNKKGASCVAAYSLRAREGAPLSFPISWEQLDEFSPSEVNIKNYKNYIDQLEK